MRHFHRLTPLLLPSPAAAPRPSIAAAGTKAQTPPAAPGGPATTQGHSGRPPPRSPRGRRPEGREQLITRGPFTAGNGPRYRPRVSGAEASPGTPAGPGEEPPQRRPPERRHGQPPPPYPSPAMPTPPHAPWRADPPSAAAVHRTKGSGRAGRAARPAFRGGAVASSLPGSSSFTRSPKTRIGPGCGAAAGPPESGVVVGSHRPGPGPADGLLWLFRSEHCRDAVFRPRYIMLFGRR